MLLALASIWGASFMLIKVGVRELEPSTLVFARVLLAMLTLLPIVLLSLRFDRSQRVTGRRRVAAKAAGSLGS